NELDPLPPDFYRPQLARHNDLKDHRRLMRRAMKGSRAEERNAVVEPHMTHEWIDPPRRVGGTERAIFGAKDQKKAPPWRSNIPLSCQPRDGRLERFVTEFERLLGGGFGEVGPPPAHFGFQESRETFHTPIICQIRRKSTV